MNNAVLRGDKKCPHGHTARRKCDICDREDDQAEIERLRTALQAIAAYDPGQFRPLEDEIAIWRLTTEALKEYSAQPQTSPHAA